MKDIKITQQRSMQPLVLQIYGKAQADGMILYQKLVSGILASSQDFGRSITQSCIVDLIGSNATDQQIQMCCDASKQYALSCLTDQQRQSINSFNIVFDSMNAIIGCQLTLNDGTNYTENISL